MSIFFLYVLILSSLMTLFRTILARTTDQEALLLGFSTPILKTRSNDQLKTRLVGRSNNDWQELYHGKPRRYQNLRKRGQSQSKSRKESKQSLPPPAPPPRIISVAHLGSPTLSRTPSIPIPGGRPRSARPGASILASSAGSSRAGSASHSPTSPQHRQPISSSSAPGERQSLTGSRPDVMASSAPNPSLLRTDSGTDLSSDGRRIFRRPKPGTVPLWATSSSEDISFDLQRKSRSSSQSRPSSRRPSLSRPSTSKPSASRNEAQKLLVSGHSRPVSAGSSSTSISRRPSMLGDPSRSVTASELTATTSKSPGTPEQVSERPPGSSFRDSAKSKSQNTALERQSSARPPDKPKIEHRPLTSLATASSTRFEFEPPEEQPVKPPIAAKGPPPRPPAVQVPVKAPPSSTSLMRAHIATSNYFNNLGARPPTSDTEMNTKNARWGKLGKVHGIAVEYYLHNAEATQSPTSGPAKSLPQILEAKPDALHQKYHQTMSTYYDRARKAHSGNDAESKARDERFRILSKYHGAVSDYFAPPPSVAPPTAPPAAPPTVSTSLSPIPRPASINTSRRPGSPQPVSDILTTAHSFSGASRTRPGSPRPASDILTTAHSFSGSSRTRPANEPASEPANNPFPAAPPASSSSIMTQSVNEPLIPSASSVMTQPVSDPLPAARPAIRPSLELGPSVNRLRSFFENQHTRL